MPKHKRPARSGRPSAAAKKVSPAARKRPNHGLSPTGSAGVGRVGAGRSPRDEASRLGCDTHAIAGVVVRSGTYLEVEPLFQRGPSFLVARDGPKPRAGDLVLFMYAHGRRVSIQEIVGRRSVLTDVLNVLLLDSLRRRGFSQKVLASAAGAAPLEHTRDSYRTDLRDLFTFTVDPVEAKDFDDALSFEQRDEGLTTVYVHIADVSYYVVEGTALDREALRRATSVYVSIGVEPMLPPALSSGVCSLMPGVDRKAVTVEMTCDVAGLPREVRFYRSLIRSDARLDYDELETVFRGTAPSDPALEHALALGRPLAQAVRAEREGRGSLRITSLEPDFLWDAQGVLVGAHPAEELSSHRFIEDFMVLANEQVASYLGREHVPTVFRVHDQPDPFTLDRLLNILSSLDLPTPVFDPMLATPHDIRRVTQETAEWVERLTPPGRGKAALSQQILRAQSRAVYQTENIGHFGLASPSYCHFTSPIRRYPDLLVHRGLLARLGIGPQPTTATLKEWAEHCSLKEREAARTELKADDIALAFLLRQRLDADGWDRAFSGQILSLVRSGMFVLFEDLHQGFLAARNIPGDYYELDDMETAMVGARTGAAYRLADLVQVKVIGIDEARGKVDLILAE